MSMFRNMMLASMRKRRRVPGLVGGWRGYGRSNSEDASTRDILPDYSGNGRDIELFNFGFTGMSGYGGYACDFNQFSISTGESGLTVTKSYNRLHIEISDGFNYSNAINILASVWDVTKGRTVKVTSSYTDVDNIQLVYGSDAREDISLNGKTFIPAYSGDANNYLYLNLANVKNKVGVIDIELLPLYPGALVSDGIDDYGQCIKDFALPDDYTVVAIRQYIGNNYGALCSKSHISPQGAFVFEFGNGATTSQGEIYSYGGFKDGLSFPDLFSYSRRRDYNGEEIPLGVSADSEQDKLILFTVRPNDRRFSKAALYDLRIYDHSLTSEELQIVKDEMMADFVKNTGVLDGIDYYDIIDCHGRSNEDGDRNRLVGRLGNLHLNLNNFGYAAGSGWNGYAADYLQYQGQNANHISKKSSSFEIVQDVTGINYPLVIRNVPEEGIAGYKVRVTGMQDGSIIKFCYYATPTDTIRTVINMTEDGVYALPRAYYPEVETSDNLQTGFWGNVNKGCKVEQFPIHPGSLVFDGVDDYAVSEEALTEPVGAFAVMYNLLKIEPTGEHYIFASNFAQNIRLLFLHNASLKWIALDSFSAVKNNQVISDNLQINYAIRTVDETISNGLLTLGSNTHIYGQANAALYQLRLIKNRLTDIQMEVVQWQMDKEHRDWCKENGYDIDEQ